jgi:hypothetical protein
MLKITARQIVAGMGTGLLAGLLVVAFESYFPEFESDFPEEECIQIGKAFNDYGAGITGIATVILAIITAVLVYVASVQNKTTRAQLRAYVFATDARVKTLPEREEPSIVVAFTNTGQTPAYKLTISGGKKVAEYPLTIDLTTEDVSIRAGALGAGLPFHITLNDLLLTENERQEMSGGKMAIYVFGRVEYKDAFCCRRWTTYRYYGFGSAHPLSPDRGQLHVHADGNDAN